MRLTAVRVSILTSALFGMTLLSTAGAAAAPSPGNCTGTGETAQVDFTAIDIYSKSSNTYAATLDARVWCKSASGADLGEVVDSGFSLWAASDPTIFINGQGSTSQNNPVKVLTPSGTAQVTISWPSSYGPTLSGFQLLYSFDSAYALGKINDWIDSGKSPLQIGPVFSATPELSSVALFGGGILSAGSYLLLRRRASRSS